MKAIPLFLLLSAFAWSQGDLAKEIEAKIDQPWIKHGRCGILVVAMSTDERIYQRDAAHVHTPASNTKLATSAAALRALGSEYRYATKLIANGELVNGELKGDLVLVGGGDPTLAAEDLKKMAEQAYASGLRKVSGFLTYDDSFFDAERYGFGWDIDDEMYAYQPQISALMLDRNVVAVRAEATAVGEPPKITISNGGPSLVVRNLAVTSARGSRNSLSITRIRAQNVFEINGSIPLGADAVSVRLSVEDPSFYAASVMAMLLREAGIEVFARPVAALAPSAKGSAIAEHRSPPMSVIVRELNKPSDNLIAEVLIKTIGREKGGSGSTSAGLNYVRSFLTEIGVAAGSALLQDGSGLSGVNAISPEALYILLKHMQGSPHRQAFEDSLPIIGVDGTLRNRLANSPVKGKFLAKTGTLFRTSAVSGYLTAKSGKRYIVSIMMNHFDAPASQARQLQDQLIELLYERL